MTAIATAATKFDQLEQRVFYTVKETARYLHLCEKQVRRLISRGELPAYRFGAALRIKRQDIDVYAEANRINGVLSQKYWRPQ